MRLIVEAAAHIDRGFHLSKIVASIFVLLVIVLVAGSCSPTEPNVSPAEPTVSPAEPTVSPAEADLTARRTAVQRRRESEVVPVGVDEHVPVQAGDRVEVSKTGRALLRFQDSLLVELFRDAEAVVSDVRLEPGGFIFVRLKQAFGFTRTRVESLADARVAVETDYATIRALDTGTEFLLGHGKPLTCIVPLEGAVEVEAQGQTMVVPAGEATYILPGEPPRPLVCANLEEAYAWADRKRGTEEVEPLGAVVKRWEQEPCPALAELPSVSPAAADLTARQTAVQRRRLSEVVPVAVDEHIPVEAGDQVEVNETGRALLRFQDHLLVELFRDTEVRVSDAQLEPGGFIFVRLKQAFGHTRTSLKSLADARVTLETDHATIRAVGTEFLICHGEALTCMVTLEGEAEVEAQDQTIAVRAGEATYILPDEPPKPVICANVEEVNGWMDRKRGTEEVEPLGALVFGWPQEPCSAATQALPTASPSAALPPSEGMVRIEGGLYDVGTPQADDFHVASQQIELEAFWIDQYEVTNAQYKAFLDETGRQAAPEWPAGTFPAGQENHPVKGVIWEEATAYCAWANKHLPTEAQWEAAARGPGPEPLLYPWGDDPRANGQVDQLPLADTYPVGAMPFNQSPFGIYDMAGNVWEWVGEPYAPVADSHKILRGGRHGLLRDMAYRQQAEPNDERFRRVAGFRCAANKISGGY